ncbi:MAG: hypothetical protein R3B96_23525 [Pirellulaceae bacterium]
MALPTLADNDGERFLGRVDRRVAEGGGSFRVHHGFITPMWSMESSFKTTPGILVDDWTASEEQAEAVLKRIGDGEVVYYKPEDPATSVLQRRLNRSYYWCFPSA